MIEIAHLPEGSETASPEPKPYFSDLPSCCQQGHSFTKRFHATSPSAAQLEALEPLTDEDRLSSYPSVPEIAALLEKMASYTYVCDVCDRCGLTVGR